MQTYHTSMYTLLLYIIIIDTGIRSQLFFLISGKQEIPLQGLYPTPRDFGNAHLVRHESTQSRSCVAGFSCVVWAFEIRRRDL